MKTECQCIFLLRASLVNPFFYVGFEILSAVTMNTAETPSVPVDRHRALKRRSASCLRGIIFDPEDGGTTFLRNVGELLPDNTPLHP
jgi:hypothetical protein